MKKKKITKILPTYLPYFFWACNTKHIYYFFDIVIKFLQLVLAVKKNTDHLAVQLRLMLHLNTNPSNNVVDCSYSITHPRKFKTKKIFQSDILTLKPFTNFCFAMLFGNITFMQIFKLKTMKATPQLLKYVFTWAKLFPRLDVLTEFLPQKI